MCVCVFVCCSGKETSVQSCLFEPDEAERVQGVLRTDVVAIKLDAFKEPLDQTLKAPTSGHNRDVDMSSYLQLCYCNF